VKQADPRLLNSSICRAQLRGLDPDSDGVSCIEPNNCRRKRSDLPNGPARNLTTLCPFLILAVRVLGA